MNSGKIKVTQKNEIDEGKIEFKNVHFKYYEKKNVQSLNLEFKEENDSFSWTWWVQNQHA